MSTLTLRAIPPWPIVREEDRRFRWILAQTLAISIAIGAIAPGIRLPESGLDSELEPPPRRVYLLAGQNGFAPVIAPESTPVAAAPPAIDPAESPTLAETAPVAPVVTPRQQVARSGVLAMQEALSELHTSAPQTTARITGNDEDAQVYRNATQPSTLTANITGGSGGIAGGVDDASVLGPAGLPDRAPRQQSGDADTRATTAVQTASARPVAKRRQEEIQEVLDRNKGAMYTLYNRELRRDATLQGKLVMSITITPQGTVTHCAILSSELNSAALQEALIALVSSIDFGRKPGAEVVTTKIPIEFFPR